MNKIFLKRQIAVLIFIFCFNSGYAQTWNQLETEYNNLTKNKQKDAALIKAKEIYSWVKVNESDTSIHLPFSLNLIGNAFVNNDSAIVYYDIALNILTKQKRDNHIQVAKILYNKATVYYNLKNDSIALITDLEAMENLKKLNFPEYPFCIWSLNRTSDFYYNKNDYNKAETYYLLAKSDYFELENQKKFTRLTKLTNENIVDELNNFIE